jgi:hypothetical protein
MVEKIKRDVRITCIYEGTSEIMEWTISRDRWQLHLKSKGAFYNEWAARLDALHANEPHNGANTPPWPCALSPSSWSAPGSTG